MYKIISSIQNPQIKQLVKLQEKSRERKKTSLFILEGKRELQLAIEGNYTIIKLFYVADMIDIESISNPINSEIIKVSLAVYKKIAYRESTEGIICIAKSKNHELNTLNLPNFPLVLVAEAPEKPGNIGAILRTADAAGIDAVIIANPKSDLYNPNIIRSSVGCIFTNQIAIGTTEQVITFLKKQNISIFTAVLKENAAYYNLQDFTKATAIVVGTEATGLSEQWIQVSDKNIIIPMLGKIDSMNVSVAAGILIYEAVRQRHSL
jgi:TrmH family RNA methyltransferase